jgi:alkylated DNA repair dioxygenase AlkB
VSPRLVFGADSFCDHLVGWIGADEADRLAERLRSELRFVQREIQLFGRRILQPRLIAWGGELPYRYSGQTLEPVPMSPVIAELRDRVAEQTGVRANHALVNRYRDENDSMGFHSDDEPELGPDPVLASVSFGAPRRFVIQPKKKSRRSETQTLHLGHGDLCVMGGRFQSELRHGVPRERSATGERINVTFRLLVRRPE